MKKPIVKKFYIRAISTNLIHALNARAQSDYRISEHEGMKCLDRTGYPEIQTLWEMPRDIYDEINAKLWDYHFVDYVATGDNLPRNVQEHFPRPLNELKMGSARKGVIKGTSLLRRLKRRQAKKELTK